MSAPANGAAGGARRILVVEDSATQAAALAALLEEHGYETVVARDGATALARVADTSLDLVLSDVVMPGLSGYDVCRRIKTELGRRDLPVVLLTGLSDPMDIIRGLESGADNYITKPYERQQLLARVRQVLANREMRRHAADGDGVEITFLGARFNITADKEQILDLLVSSYEELVRTNHAVRQAEQRSRFLAEATGILTASLDADRVLGGVARFAVPALADVCIADVIDVEGRVRRVEVAAAPAFAEVAVSLRAATPTADDGGLVSHVLRQRSPVLLADVSAEALQAIAPGVAALHDPRAAGLRSLLAVPLAARGHTLGALVLLGGVTRQRYGPEDLALAQELARQTALAVDNARLYDAAQQATRARDDVLAIVSHDLRNPIHAIYMASSFLLETLPEAAAASAGDAVSRRQAEVIRRSAQRANALIGDLLDVTRIEAGRLTVTAEPADAAELVAEAVNDATPLALDKGLQLVIAADPALPRVQADRARIAQLFGNLLGNAIKFTPEGGAVTVRARATVGEVRFAVTDTGPGIPPDHLPHLFDRYWQARETAQLGTGLGLFIAKGITEAHGGRMWAESRLGDGATFWFTLPVV